MDERRDDEFVIVRNGKLETYTRYEDIPETFAYLVKFAPYVPRGPHTPEQHAEIAEWAKKFQELLKRGER